MENNRDAFGIRYAVEKNLEIVHKEKYFKTEKALTNFICKQGEKDDSFCVESFSNPQI